MERKQPALFDLVFCLILSFCFYFLPFLSFASEKKEVQINEIAWMGTQKSANDEWIELYNNANYGINLDGWSLKAPNSINISLTGIIPAKGFYLLERTDDQTVPEVVADIIYKGALSNKGQKISLYDSNHSLIDEADCSSGWFWGDNATKQTMERVGFGKNGSFAGSWQTSAIAGGTAKKDNSIPFVLKNSELAKDQPVKNETDSSLNKINSSPDSAEKTGKTGLKTMFSALVLAALNGSIIVFLKKFLRNNQP